MSDVSQPIPAGKVGFEASSKVLFKISSQNKSYNSNNKDVDDDEQQQLKKDSWGHVKSL